MFMVRSLQVCAETEEQKKKKKGILDQESHKSWRVLLASAILIHKLEQRATIDFNIPFFIAENSTFQIPDDPGTIQLALNAACVRWPTFQNTREGCLSCWMMVRTEGKCPWLSCSSPSNLDWYSEVMVR